MTNSRLITCTWNFENIVSVLGEQVAGKADIPARGGRVDQSSPARSSPGRNTWGGKALDAAKMAGTQFKIFVTNFK